jgi:hypothetical protein
MSTRRYDVKFILCEDVRVETNAKVSLAGIYPGELIVLLRNPDGLKVPTGHIALLPRLSFVFFVVGPGGTVEVATSVTGPNGEKVVASYAMPGKIEDGKASTFGITGTAFPVPALGKYTVELALDRESYKFEFSISAGPEFRASDTRVRARRKAVQKPATKVSTRKRGNRSA